MILKLQRVKLSREADNRLRMLKARTGLDNNIICRLGFCLSLEEPGEPRSDSSDPSLREINRYTLLGEYDPLFVALLNARHPAVGDDADELQRLFLGAPPPGHRAVGEPAQRPRVDRRTCSTFARFLRNDLHADTRGGRS